MKLAIVGSQEKAWRPDQFELVQLHIRLAVSFLQPDIIISGCSPGGGVDVWAEGIANDLGVVFEGYPPTGNGWAAYRARNIEMANACDSLVCIRSMSSKTYGSGWTADEAHLLGKPVWRFLL